MATVTLSNVSVGYGDQLVLRGINLTARAGEIVAVVGPNGVGKSTLLKVILGEHAPDDGEVVRPSGLRVAYLGPLVPMGLSGSALAVNNPGVCCSPPPSVT